MKDTCQVVTLHYIDVNYQLKKFAISSQQINTTGHTSLDDCIKQIAGLNASKTKLFSVTNNADESLSEFVTGEVECAATRLQLLINHFLRHVETTCTDILTKCRVLSNLAPAVAEACNRLTKKAQTVSKMPPSSKSVSLMGSIIEVKDTLLDLALQDPAVAESMPTEQQFEMMEKLLEMLESFEQATNQLSQDNSVTLHLVVVTLSNLNAKLQKFHEESNIEAVKKWASFAKKLVDKSFPEGGCLNKYYVLAHYFDPFYKGAMCFDRASYFITSLLQELAAEGITEQVCIFFPLRHCFFALFIQVQ